MITIKTYTATQYEMIKSWWDKQGEICPTEDMLPLESTWILYIKDTPALCVCLYYTNIKEYCYIENFVGNPDFKGPERKEGTRILLKYIGNAAKDRGYKKLVCLASNKELARYYQIIGFTATLTNVTTFCKVL